MQGPELEQVIRQNIEGVQTLIVSDVSGGCGQAFDVIIVSPIFEGLPTLKRHRLVNERLKDQIAQLHAFSQKTYTPAQYEALSGKTAIPAAAAAAAGSSSSASPSSAPVAAAMAAPAGAGASSLAAPMTPPTKTSRPTHAGASHNRTASNVSIPELTLTTDDETISGRAASGAPRPLTPRDQPGGTTSKAAPLSDVDYHSSPSSATPASTGISRLHASKIASVDFWEGLRAWLETQMISPASPAANEMATSPLASPGGTGGRDQVKGETELVRLWEDFFQSQKPHLSASDVAKVRDGVGMFGWH